MSDPPPTVADLRARLDGLTASDAARLGRRLRRAAPEALPGLADRIAVGEARLAARRAAVPEIDYPDLPVSAMRAELGAAIAAHQVVVVAGETGSGKTTQLPKICLDAGRGVRGMIGHTQPRRLAARTVAQRIADELDVPLGDVVGYAVRFTDQVGERTLVKLMTDGILLAEIQRDPRLLAYDTLILDEAHERSLNVDFLLGYLRRLLPRRPDLKVIVTSATIEPERFAVHFATDGVPAPIVEVSGRTYPVEIRYRPPEPEVDRTDAIIAAVEELSAEPPGDVLVFLSGEREIRDTAEALTEALNGGEHARRAPTEVLPLYARLPTAEQQRVFAPHAGRRVVLATNVAETSLTVPGIRYVVDPGEARISRYNRRTKVQRLPIEPISQASAAQRAGRSGRVAPGVCIRLYAEEDFAARPRQTDPEILRTNLAAVLLRMAALGLGSGSGSGDGAGDSTGEAQIVGDFPFLDPPDARSVRDGAALLRELGAFDAAGTLTALGRRLARLPVDPRLGRMILAAADEGCVREVLVLAAAMSVVDPRERPTGREEAARAQHARFADEHSDFVAYLNLWNYLRERRRELSGSAFRRMCRDEFLHYLRVREWQDLVGQLRGIAGELGIRESDEPADPARVHAALLAGLLSQVGMRIDRDRDRDRADGKGPREYLGARNATFVLAPGTVLAKRAPRWVMVAELVETNRLYGRTAARVEPETVERLAGDLVVRSHSEPHWDARRAAVMAYERVTLFGLPLIAGRRVGYGTIEPAVAREMFLRHALVEGDWETRHRFAAENARLRAEVDELEERTRRRDLAAGDDELLAFYERRVPAEVVSGRHFDAWWKRQRHQTPDLLTMTRADVLREPAEERPDSWRAGDVELPLTYRFDPTAVDDGVTVHVPVDVLASLSDDEFDWHVPALREELVTELIRTLPKQWRRQLVPAPDTARAVAPALDPAAGPLLPALASALTRLAGVPIPPDAFDLARLPAHLRVTFAVEGSDGGELDRGKDLAALRRRLAAPARRAVAEAFGEAPAGDSRTEAFDGGESLVRNGLRDWPAGLAVLPGSVERILDGRTVRGYPGLVAAGATVDLRVFADPAERDGAALAGLVRLLRAAVPSPVKAAERALDTRTRLMLANNPDGSLSALLEDCADAAAAALAPTPVSTAADFAALRDRVAAALPAGTRAVSGRVVAVLGALHRVRVAIPTNPPAAQVDSVADVVAQMDRLTHPGFVAATGAARLGDLTRYLTAALHRLERLPSATGADRDKMARVHAVADAYRELLAGLPPARAADADVREIGWQIEEFRVSLFAQHLGTARPVSEPRLHRAIAAIRS